MDVVTKTIVPVTISMMQLFPDGLVIASGLYALITLSYPFGVFFGSMVEATVIYRFIQWIASYTNMTGNMAGADRSYSASCRTGFSIPSSTMTMLSMFGDNPLNNPFPSAPIYMLATAASYIFTTLNFQAKELQALGPAYSSRYYVSATLLFILLGIFVVFRVMNGCDSFGLVMVTIPIGLIVGTVLVQQNMRLFGQSSTNLLGIPLLRNRTANGKKLYVCPK